MYTLKNCISAGTGGYSSWITTVPSASPSTTVPVQATNGWNTGFLTNNADFVSVDPMPTYGARQADGSLPVMTFMHLATGSDLIDRGTNIGLAFNGTAPDLGCFETNATIPVTLIDFKAALKDKNVALNWSTATEQNNAGWHIERSTTGKDDWQDIGFVKGNGSTNTPQYFSFLDNNPLPNTNYYRLKQTDFDGLGQQVTTVLSETKASGTHLLTLKTADILRGVYFIVLTTNEGVEVVRFVKN